jgi:hypothetical protein
LRTLFILAFTAVVSASCGTASLSANRTVTPTLTRRPLPTLPAVFVPAGAHPRHTPLRRQHRLLLPAGR